MIDERELTPDERERVSLVRRGFQLFVGGDIEGMLELYHPEVEITGRDWMNAGPFHGHGGFMEWSRLWFEAWEDFDYDVQSIVPVGQRHVVAAVRIRGRGARSGIEVEDVAGWLIEVQDRQAIYVEVALRGPERSRWPATARSM